MSARDRLRRLVEELPEGVVEEAERALRSLSQRDPLLRALENAPEDDELLTDEERIAIQKGLEAARRGDLHRLEDVKGELGL